MAKGINSCQRREGKVSESLKGRPRGQTDPKTMRGNPPQGLFVDRNLRTAL